MYTIHNDGKLLYGASFLEDLLSPQLSLDVNGAGSLSFVMPPGHEQYDAIRKLKGIITVKQYDKTIFRGRALDDERDFFKQKNVYCEGDRSFLLDSQCAPYTYTGTALGLYQKLITEHNEQVEVDKQFAIGNVTAVTDETLTVENVAYWETWKELDEKLLSVYGGYMMTRTEGGTTYLDWLAVSGRTNAQTIAFSVNLLDLRDKVDAADVFTILIPLGASVMGDDGEYSPPVNIESVNNGCKYIQDDEAVARYGKIWRTKTWNYVEDPAELLLKGQEYMKTGIALQTLTLKAIDMHFIDGSAEAIRVGDHVRIVSEPHGLDITIICTKIDIDLVNPENTTYTFGEPPRTLTENIVQTEDDVSEMTGGRGGGGGRSVKEELKDYIRWAEIKIDEDEAMIQLLTGEVSKQGERLSTAEITLDGVNAQIVLKADLDVTDELGRRVSAAEIEIDGLNAEIILKANQTAVDDLVERVSAAEIEIDGANAQIALKANSSTVDALGNRVSSAEIEIDGLNSEIVLKANKVYVDAEITSVKTLIAEEIEAVYSDVNYSIAESISTKALTVNGNAWASGTLTAGGLSAGSLTLGGDSISKTTIPVVTSFTQALGESAPTQNYTLLTVA